MEKESKAYKISFLIGQAIVIIILISFLIGTVYLIYFVVSVLLKSASSFSFSLNFLYNDNFEKVVSSISSLFSITGTIIAMVSIIVAFKLSYKKFISWLRKAITGEEDYNLIIDQRSAVGWVITNQLILIKDQEIPKYENILRQNNTTLWQPKILKNYALKEIIKKDLESIFDLSAGLKIKGSLIDIIENIDYINQIQSSFFIYKEYDYKQVILDIFKQIKAQSENVLEIINEELIKLENQHKWTKEYTEDWSIYTDKNMNPTIK